MLQTRYASYEGNVSFLPGMQVILPPNPKAQFDPAFIETAFNGALTHLAGAEAALAPALSGDFSTTLPLNAIWMDIDQDDQRAEWETLLTLLSGMGAVTTQEQFDGVVRFDAADAEWLVAYVHMVSGMSELVLSLDPSAWRTARCTKAAPGSNGPARSTRRSSLPATRSINWRPYC